MKMSFITNSPLVHLLFPHHCVGCGSDIVSAEQFICLECIHELPLTHYAFHPSNPVEKIFWGRCSIKAAMSEWYFAKSSVVQNLIHEFKYKGNKELGIFLGNMIGKSLAASHRFTGLDYIIPLPLFHQKERLRGYNQAEILARGIAEIIQVPLEIQNVTREVATETQTRKHRTERWENVENTFKIKDAFRLEGKNLLLIDDVITTGATLEACARALLSIPGTRLSIATLAVATH